MPGADRELSMADIRPTSFSLGGRGERFLFFDAFIKDRRLVLVSTFYPDPPMAGTHGSMPTRRISL